MDQFSSSKPGVEIDCDRIDGEEQPPQSQDMFSSSLIVNGKTTSNSSSSSSLTNCSLNEEANSNGDSLANNLNRYVDATEVAMSPRKLPTLNTPEKIIFCVDICEDVDTTPFKLMNGKTFKPLYMVKRVIQIFVHNKQLLNKNHEFALMLLQSDNVLWLKNFTRDTREVTSVIDDLLEINSEPGKVCSLSELMDVVQRYVNLPAVEPANMTQPPYTVRMILFYCRSRCVPEFLAEDGCKELLSSEFFTVDIVYVHESTSEQNRCQEVYSRLNELAQKGYSYVFDVERNPTKLHNIMAKLLAHPLQRPLQKCASYALPEPQQPE
ncbi:hypothetical protein PR048_001776 [Dryococelus australis]|uniref:BRISC and BRCA1-A complex member 1 n=1 Tax=Dryococelus australis TaxID=614101 RepID=A0ABQ9II92_9NEOP|nr:hypothetical protein PR048_001776 [Dryococelus australis]